MIQNWLRATQNNSSRSLKNNKAKWFMGVSACACFYNNNVARSIYNIGDVPEKSGRVIVGGVSINQELELLLLRRRWASVELSTGSRVAVGGRERASNVAVIAPWREIGEERG